MDSTWQFPSNSNTLNDPLLDCLLIVAKHHKRDISAETLRSGLPQNNNVLTVENFPRAAVRADLSTRLLKQPLQKLPKLSLPAILLLKPYDACIVTQVDYDKQFLHIIFPEAGDGETVVSFQEMEKTYSGYTFFLQPKYKDTETNIADRIGNIKNWFWGPIFSSWKIYRDVFVASFLINLFALATPFFILNIYDRVIPNSALDTLWVLSSGIMIIYLFELIIRGLRGYFVDEAGKKANLLISAALFKKVLGLKMEVVPKATGSFAKKLQQFENIRDFITSFSITTLIDVPFVFLGLFALWYLAGNIVWIHVVAIVTLVIYAALVQLPLKKAIQNTFKASAQKNAVLIEGLNGLETIKLLGAESRLQQSWEESVSFIAKWSARARFLSTSVSHVSVFIQHAVLVAVVIAGVYFISTNQLSKGGLIACIILSRRTVSPMSQVANLATRFHKAKESLLDLNHVMNLPVERPEGKTFLYKSNIEGSIECRDLSFTYPFQKNEILHKLNLQIQPKERVAIIGPTGSGKTTLLKILLGLYQASSGMIGIDGVDVRQIDPAELRRFVGFVPQDVTLFRGSVKDNILLGTRGIDDNQLQNAVEQAGVIKFTQKHPKGLDLEVGERGKNLSGGQRQSVALARAFIHDPPLFVFDEPSKSLDNRTEMRLKENLKTLLQNKTLLVVTHRASLLDLVDRIIVLDNGKIVADAPRDRIIQDLQSGALSI
ncbi:type I secretion system permease/ATPase [Desulfogranum marinum]|uniref:type I secretion system permease/ATPase n=1 Tax=Desulfogranum marinum TaxID=453220 RepID=UPI0029C6D400|nr:type I secretion system permease/ATPase [Desulfogranum marinum]